jgi:DNA polymerase III epsilon subunit-like protein
MHDYAVWDLETTGLNPNRDVITELGWLRVIGGIPQEPHAILVNCGVPVPAEVAAITGITTDLLLDAGWTETVALGAFFADTADLPLVGHNILRFDANFLEAACRRVGIEPPHRRRYIDTAAEYKARCLGIRRYDESYLLFAQRVLERRAPGLKYSLTHCCREYGIPTADVTAHRAGGDVVLTQRLYEKLCASEVVV